MKPDSETQLKIYSDMVTSRYFESRIAEIYMEGKTPKFDMANGPIPGEMHLSNGQEPVAAGVCAHLGAEDVVTATHRPHHIAIAKGVDLERMAAEIFGKKTGLSGGRGGHMHLFDTRVNFCCSGIIGEGMGPAAGAALARQMNNAPGVAVAFIGEGAVNQGAFHEVMNLASVWKLPFVCVIEDNAWGISVSKSQSTAVAHNDLRASAYGIPGYRCENDADEIYAVAGEAIARARNGEGPSLIEIKTVRLVGHFLGDAEGYRSKEEKASLQAADPIPPYRQRLRSDAGVSEQALEAIDRESERRVEAALDFARESEEPRGSEALDQVFAEVANG